MRLQLENVTKNYKDVNALKGFNLDVSAGIYGILGPNGAGKSTLLKILTGNETLTSGRMYVDGNALTTNRNDEYLKRIGYVPQNIAVYPHFTLREYLEYMAVMKGYHRKDELIQNQIREYTLLFHLDDVMKRRLKTFSGGMKRRAMIIQALLGHPELLILDEPTAGLDPGERLVLKNLLMDMAGERIVILATHITDDIECIADQVVLMRKGELISCTEPQELIRSVERNVMVMSCTKSELKTVRNRYHVSKLAQTETGFLVQVVDGNRQFEANEYDCYKTVGLEDVYLYYFDNWE